MCVLYKVRVLGFLIGVVLFIKYINSFISECFLFDFEIFIFCGGKLKYCFKILFLKLLYNFYRV